VRASNGISSGRSTAAVRDLITVTFEWSVGEMSIDLEEDIPNLWRRRRISRLVTLCQLTIIWSHAMYNFSLKQLSLGRLAVCCQHGAHFVIGGVSPGLRNLSSLMQKLSSFLSPQ